MNLVETLEDMSLSVYERKNRKLNKGLEPVAAHLATLAMVGAIAGIEWDVVKKRKNENLVAFNRLSERNSRLNRFRHVNLGRRTLLASGVELVSLLEFDYFYHEEATFGRIKSVLPESIHNSLVKPIKVRPPLLPPTDILLQGTSLTLEARPEKTKQDNTIRIGIIAVHSEYEHKNQETKIGFKRIQELNGVQLETSSVFRPIMENEWSPVSYRPENHFEFHQALGVPQGTLDLARQNYSVLNEYLDLPDLKK